MASFFTFDRNISTIAREFKQNGFLGNAFSEIFFRKGISTDGRVVFLALRRRRKTRP